MATPPTTQQDPPLNIRPKSPVAFPDGTIPNTMVAVVSIAFSLGIIFCAGLQLMAPWWWPQYESLYQYGFMISALAFFHFAEFAVTAGWNREKVSVDSFLLNNGRPYWIAHAGAAVEWMLEWWLRPQWKTHHFVSLIGIILTLLSQVLRSAAMIHASSNFSHQIAYRKSATHQLVTDGVYSWTRHPSYTGFFFWGLGMQLVLLNPVSFLGFGFILWRFFNARIRNEEVFLVRFFGDDYRAYKQRVGTLIPFIR